MKSERYLAIMRPVVRDLLRIAQRTDISEQQTTFNFSHFFGVEGVTQQEYIQAVKWLVDALDNAQVTIRLDINTSESAGGDDA